MSAIVFLLLGSIAPLITGPLAGIVYIEIIKRRKALYQLLFWALLVILNLLIMAWVASSSGKWLPVSSLSAFLLTPAAAILTIPVMRRAWHKLQSTGGMDRLDKRWFSAGLVLIPVLQLGLFAALLIFGPQLCKAGLLVCPDL